MSLKMKFNTKGLKKVKKELEKLAKEFPQAVAAQEYEEGVRIYNNMIPRMPYDTGLMESQAYVTPPSGRNNKVVEIGVGGDPAKAIRQHEDTSLQHTFGEARFLDKAARAVARGLKKRFLVGVMQKIKAGKPSWRKVRSNAPKRPT